MGVGEGPLGDQLGKPTTNWFFSGWTWAPGVVELIFQLEMTLPTTILIQENQGLLSIERKKRATLITVSPMTIYSD